MELRIKLSYRTAEEIEWWRQRDPVSLAGSRIGAAAREEIYAEVEDLLTEVEEFALGSPKPAPAGAVSNTSGKAYLPAGAGAADGSALLLLLGEYEVNTVIHLAAQTIVGIANRNPISTFESNVRGTWTILEACRRSPALRQIVVASSDKAYGDQETLPYDEQTPLQGQHPYDVSKSCADLIAHAYAATYDLPVAITRCGNFFGGGDLNWNRIVPGTIRSIIRSTLLIIRSNGRFVSA
jgi:nucleoside-diphosphate-sugar epimerase